MLNSGFHPVRARADSLWCRRPGWRSVALCVAAAFLFFYPTYVYVMGTIDHGITRHGDLLAVDLKAMSSFEMDQDRGTDAQIPAAYRALDGKRVELTGQMYDPYGAAGNVRAFTLVYSVSNCCFNGPPKVQHLVQATVPQDESVKYSPNFVQCVGTLHVGVQSAEGKVQSIYRLDVEKVMRE